MILVFISNAFLLRDAMKSPTPFKNAAQGILELSGGILNMEGR